MAARADIRHLLAALARSALAFVLAFSCTFAFQQLAYADDPQDEQTGQTEQTGEDPAEGDGDNEEGGDGGGDEPVHAVEGITLFRETLYEGAGREAVADSWLPTPEAHGALTSKGAVQQFYVQLVWEDGSTSWAGDLGETVTWHSSDPAVADVTTTGALTAHANGAVTVTAECLGFSVSWIVDVSGQNEELYVEQIEIVDENGVAFDSGAGITLEDLNQTVKLVARVTVVDPATGVRTALLSSDGALSAQTGGQIADLAWSVNDSELGYVEPTTGEYRPAEYGSVLVTAASRAGLGGATVSGGVWVSTTSPYKQEDGRNPQPAVTVRAYYELAPDQIVAERTFTRAQLEALGTELHSYTVVGRGTFATASARGVLLATVLEAAGCNLAGISHFSFGTADTPKGEVYGETVSYRMLFGQTRYYFPNYAVGGNDDGAVAVPPMLAIDSNMRWFNPATGLGEEEDYADMNDDLSFRLLFGSTGNGQTTSSKQIYWIHTINVVLAGAPPEQAGDGDGGGSGSGAGASSGSGTGSAAGAGRAGTAAGAAAGGISRTIETADAAGAAGDEAIAEAAEDPGSEAGRWSVYQIMNPYASDVEDLDFENPWAPFAGPIACGIAAAGAAQAGARFRRQTRPIRHAAA